MIRYALTAIAALATSLALAPLGHASFPGRNGPLVLSIENCYFSRYLVRVPWRGGELTPITEKCGPGDDAENTPPRYAAPEAAPGGGSLLAIEENHGFVTMTPDGTDLAPVALPDEVNAIAGPSTPSFAPNGQHFAFEADRNEHGHDVEPLWDVRLDGSSARRIRDAMPCERGQECSTFESPRWSPDGKLIAVQVVTYRRGLESGLWLVRARDGKAIRRVGGPRATGADWSPDGRRLVYSTQYWQREIEGGASGGNIYVVDRKGEHTRTLVHREDIAETQPTWSPNGRRIVWVSLDFTAGDVGFRVFPSLWSIRARGGTPRLIQGLPEPDVEEGEFTSPQLTWLARAD